MTYLGLLRAINLLGYNRVAMADLREFLTGLGFTEPRTLLQSGNVVFRSRARSAARLERQLEREAEKSLGVKTDFMVRTVEEWKEVIAGNPFPAAAASDPSHLLVTFLKDAPKAGALDALRSAMRGPEQVEVEGRHAYIVYPEGIARSKLTTALLERKLGTRGTARNWNTVTKLGALAET